MTLEQVEREIAGHYRWFAKEAPGVTPMETGALAQLWAVFDRKVEEQRVTMYPDEFYAEFGNGAWT